MNIAQQTANELIGREAFDAIPKSVLAVMCWYLADACSDRGVGNDGEIERLIQELEALKGSSLIGDAQAKRSIAALRKVCK